MKSIVKTITVCFLIISIISCNHEKRETENKVSQFMGDSLFLPEISEVIYKDSLYEDTNHINNKAKFKVVTLLWGDCNSCIEDLKKWDKLYQYVEKKNEIEILFYLYTSDIEFFRKNLYNKEIHKYPLILDKNSNYIERNKLPFNNKVYHTFLLNSDNEVILVGNPTHSEKLMKLYKEEINKQLNLKKISYSSDVQSQYNTPNCQNTNIN